jgi:predicted RNA binding protein YcfA (HicA-like mRNA interferase family)
VSPKLRQLSGRDVVRALATFGFEISAQSGSHVKLRRVLPGGQRQTLTIPLHAALATGTAHAIFRQASRYVPEADLRPFFFTK